MKKIFTLEIKRFTELLFFTNLWINIYSLSLILLNHFFPSPTILPYPKSIFLTDDVTPEPFEIPLYIATALLMVSLIYLSCIKNIFGLLYEKYIYTPKTKLILFTTLFTVFLIRLGVPIVSPSTPITRQYFLYYLSFLFLGFIFIMASRLIKNRRKNILIYIFVLIFISILTFEPKFPVTWDNYSHFFGPILEIARGQTIYTQAISQYSFLWILILAFLAKLGIDIMYLPILMWLLFIIEYFICFYLIFKISKSLFFALSGLFSIITVNYFLTSSLPISVIQINAIRWPQLITACLVFYKISNFRSFRYLLIISALALLTIDSGIELLLAYILTLLIFFLKRLLSMKQLFATIFKLFSIIVVFFLLLNTATFLANHELISLSSMFNKLVQFSKNGYMMIPIPHFGFFWLILLFYIASLLLFFKKSQNNSRDIKLIVFIANLSLFSSLNYLGRSHPDILFNISLFPILSISLMTGNYIKTKPNKKFIASVVFLIFFIIIPAYIRQGYLTNIVHEKLSRMKSQNIFNPEMRSILTKKYAKEITLINNFFPEKEIVLLSPDDTYLLYITNKYNIIRGNPQNALDTIEEIKLSVKNIVEACPKKIVVDCRIFDENCSNNPPLVYLSLAQPPILKELENKCKASYQKTVCSGQICVGQSE